MIGAQVILLMLVHLVGDFYATFYYPLVPYFREHFALSLTATGALAALLTSCQSYFQPLAGMIEDRLGARRAILAAMLAAAIGSGLLGFVWNLPSLCAALIVGGVGVGLFHPVGAAVAGRSAGGNRVAAIAVYVVGGSLGVVIAPVVVPRVAAADIRWLGALAIPGLLFTALLWARLRTDEGLAVRAKSRFSHIWPVLRRIWPIHVDVVLRFIAIDAFYVWLPVLARARGEREGAEGQSLAFTMLVGAAGVLAGGYAGARFASRRIVILSEIVAAAAWILAPMTYGVLFYLLLAVGGFLVYVVTPIQIAAAQRLAPQTESAASGIVMGLAGGNAGLMMLPLGWLGDHWTATTGSELISVQRGLQVSACCLIVAAILSFMVRSDLTETECARS